MYKCIRPAYIDGKLYAKGAVVETVPKGWDKNFSITNQEKVSKTRKRDG
ncbi:MAG: hypothetical protein H6Q72_960 [Firmicutes bacterium]|nr:hypothetical protein [Bacillota bacterium]